MTTLAPFLGGPLHGQFCDVDENQTRYLAHPEFGKLLTDFDNAPPYFIPIEYRRTRIGMRREVSDKPLMKAVFIAGHVPDEMAVEFLKHMLFVHWMNGKLEVKIGDRT